MCLNRQGLGKEISYIVRRFHIFKNNSLVFYLVTNQVLFGITILCFVVILYMSGQDLGGGVVRFNSN